ncbi:MAG: hypothetical protein KKF22_13180 [Gammaproteobacteria bacterium]|nr:hypothetical protein [Gammaproteobacteria bacterium]
MSIKPVLEGDFHHDGRGPELQRVVWKLNGVVLAGFEYFNPEDEYIPENLRHLILEGVEAYSMASEEVHASIMASRASTSGASRGAVFEVINSSWLVSLDQTHISECKHYQIMFYDEIYDVVCKGITSGLGRINV